MSMMEIGCCGEYYKTCKAFVDKTYQGLMLQPPTEGLEPESGCIVSPYGADLPA